MFNFLKGSGPGGGAEASAWAMLKDAIRTEIEPLRRDVAGLRELMDEKLKARDEALDDLRADHAALRKDFEQHLAEQRAAPDKRLARIGGTVGAAAGGAAIISIIFDLVLRAFGLG